MSIIKLLDDLTIDQIAAGEVLEGPSSCIKEMVENSIDAGSTKIEVEVKNGGKTFIRVTDNGCGIAKDDIKIAFERHATSKIRSSNDLSKIVTMGFRGEALASIASVSKVTLKTKQEKNEIGYKYIIKGGNEIFFEEEIPNNGTTIIVEDLFYNTPVRFKFLKSDSSEYSKIKKIMTKIAISHLNISFRLINNGTLDLKTNGNGNIKDAVYELFGKEIANNIILIDKKMGDLKITGCVGNSRIEESYRNREFFFVNNRSVENDVLSSGIEQAFKGALKQHKYPFGILNIDISPELIDVNIHPTKKDIKFQNPKDVFDIIYQSVREALLKEDFLGEDETRTEQEVMDEYVEKSYITSGIYDTSLSPKANYLKDRALNPLNYKDQRSNIINNYENINQSLMSGRNADQIIIQNNDGTFNYKFIGVIFKTFILVEIKDTLYLIDQHAAHERILYEQVKASYNSNQRPDTQMLIIPTVLSLSRSEVELVKDNINIFEKVGFVIEDFGENTLKISGVPSIAYDLDSNTIFRDTMQELSSFSRTTKQDIENKFIATVACKAAVKAGMVLTFKEIDNLIQNLFRLPNPYTCPHGRPTTVKYDKEDLLKKLR
jgi:DNA mismatch repair protein MutL